MGISLEQLLDSMLGIHSRFVINDLVSTVGVTSQQIMRANPNRLGFVIFNLSVVSLYVSPQSDVSATRGMYVASNGGYISVQWDKDMQLPASEWFGIAGGAASSIFIIENIST